MNLLEEVDSIVRSMEDEKASKDDSEKTRDALARIEGLDRDPVSKIHCITGPGANDSQFFDRLCLSLGHRDYS
jgi:hypothetical protein